MYWKHLDSGQRCKNLRNSWRLEGPQLRAIFEGCSEMERSITILPTDRSGVPHFCLNSISNWNSQHCQRYSIPPTRRAAKIHHGIRTQSLLGWQPTRPTTEPGGLHFLQTMMDKNNIQAHFQPILLKEGKLNALGTTVHEISSRIWR